MPAAAFWICCWAYFNCAGWVLSALHLLSPAGYAAITLPAAVLALAWLKKNPPAFSPAKFRHRFRRPLPAVFLAFASLFFLGGVLYAPGNYDALTYRLPRLMNWLAAGHWFWIPAVNERMNYSGVGWEWTALPLLALTRSDRALFLINLSGFLLMPGLLFAVFRQFGAARRVAWHWMWLLPLAYGYATQAGSIGNDLSGAVLGLGSVFFGLRARRTGRLADLWLALLAAAVMTGVKLSNAPLALPCLVAVWPALPLLRKHLAASLLLAGVALLISAAPIMVLNQIHCGSWKGDPGNQAHLEAKKPAAALLGNGLLLAEDALMPPLLPGAAKIHVQLRQKLPAAWLNTLTNDYPRYFLARPGEMPTEEGAGLGLGITVMWLAGLGVTGWLVIRGRARPFFYCRLPWLAAAVWVAALVYLFKMGSEASARLMNPYYPLLLVPLLLLAGQKQWLQFRVGRLVALLAALSVLPPIVLSPLRPLWPGKTICEKLAREHPGQLQYQRMASVYSVFAHRNNFLAPLREHLPAEADTLGFIAGSNDTDYSLWRPFGRRRVVYLGADNGELLKHPATTDWLVVKEAAWPDYTRAPLADWTQTNGFRRVYATELTELVAWGPEKWSLWHREK